MDQLKIPVEEFTTPNPITTSEDTSVSDLRRLMKDNGIRHILITNNNKVTGIISERDLHLVEGLNVAPNVKAKDIMTKDPVSVSSEEFLDEVALKMSEKKIGSVVVHEGDELLGIFTVTDALNALVEIVRSELPSR